MSKRWKKRPKNSNWGDFGDNDQIGRLNFITQDKVLQGIQEVKLGKTFCLSLPLDYPGGQVLNAVRQPPILKPVIRNNSPYFNYKWSQLNTDNKDIGSDDVVILSTQYSTQWDSLAHRGKEFDINGNGNLKPVYYNGFSAEKDVIINKNETSSANALGIENMAEHGVQGRGVLVDLHTHCGDFPRKEVGFDLLMQLMNEQDVIVEKGDVLCLWTGLDQLITKGKGNPDPSIKEACAVLDGSDKKLQQWVIDSGVAAIASDNLAVEAIGKPVDDCCNSNLPIHDLCLFRLGVHLGELWHLAELAKWLRKNNRNSFLLTAPPLRLTGAVGSPVTPIATV